MADDALVDVKLIQKPSRFSGDESKWRDWKFAFENYLACVDNTFPQDLDGAEAAGAASSKQAQRPAL